jgi:carbonic anhydrase
MHFPSEHAVDGVLSAGELHVDHRKIGTSGVDDLLVIGLMHDVGAESAFLQRLGLPSGAPSNKSVASLAVSGAIDLGVKLVPQRGGNIL